MLGTARRKKGHDSGNGGVPSDEQLAAASRAVASPTEIGTEQVREKAEGMTSAPSTRTGDRLWSLAAEDQSEEPPDAAKAANHRVPRSGSEWHPTADEDGSHSQRTGSSATEVYPQAESDAVEASSTGSPAASDHVAAEVAEEREVPAGPTRLCPHCAALSHTAGDFCPYCGGRFSAQGGGGSSRMSTRVKVIAGCLVPLLVLGGAGVAVAIKLHHDSQVTAQHSRAAAAAKQREQQLQQQQQVQQTQRATKISARQDAETQLQTAITKDATDKANQGVLTSGPAQSTSCTGVSGGSSQSLSESTGTYNCIAVYQTASDGTQSGYRYSGTIDFDTGSMTWQLGASG